VEIIKQQTMAGRPWLRMAVWSQVKVCGLRLSLRPIGCTLALSVAALWYVACGDI